MAIVRVKIGGHDYQLACDDGQEEQLRFLADEVDDRVRDLFMKMGANPGETMSLLLAAVTMADELIDNKKEINRLSAEVRRLANHIDAQANQPPEGRLGDMEDAMAQTLAEIAERIEKIAGNIEVR